MRNESSTTIRRADYRPPAYLVDQITLLIDLDRAQTRVQTTLQVRRNRSGAGGPLLLDGEDLELVAVHVDGAVLAADRYELRQDGLILPEVASHSEVRIENLIHPKANSALMGLFVSNGNFFTQCEAEGFRRITFFPDRPDVMARYEATLRADSKSFPVLLSNGNLIESGKLPQGRHYARWADPFPKPSYLFALVAGRFDCEEAHYRTASGRDVLLQVWVEPGQRTRAVHAMTSLQRAIAWDEQRFGLELDLDRFMIVASNDFNLGAMENKGLNIFNAKYVLADAQIATDADYQNIETIVGHEYFHNWTGNRVTCRDWFQLSLKEGLTVFREQEFAADMAGDAAQRAVCRIDQVRYLRATQFPEDAGPMAHPVRPDSYQEIGNFYTPTVYEKGAEVVRMLHALLGVDGFRRGLELYFNRHDGQAVTCDDFVAAMADANGRDLAQFQQWYAQAGTPRLTASGRYFAPERRFELTIMQSCPPTPGQPDKRPLLIPLALGLVDSAGRDLPLRLQGEPPAVAATTRVLELHQATQTFDFIDVETRPVPSLARGFSAPVLIDYRYDDDELALLAKRDSDPFNRWDAVQRLALNRLLAATDAFEMELAPSTDSLLTEVVSHLLAERALAPSFRRQAVALPAEAQIAEHRAMIDPVAVRAARQWLLRGLGRSLGEQWRAVYRDLQDEAPYQPDLAAAGRRALRNAALTYLVDSGADDALELARAHLDGATNMTDRQAALSAIVNSAAPFKADLLVRFARDWAHEPLLMNKWFQLQSTAVVHDGEVPVLNRVRVLLKHRCYSPTNPNNVYALVLGFCMNNAAEFHRTDGAGYAFWVEQVLTLDRINPTVAARVARALERWRKYTPQRQQLMQAALAEVNKTSALSRDVREIVTKALDRT